MYPWLEQYPNREKANLLLNGFEFGFPILEFKGTGCRVVPHLQSVSAFPQVVWEKVRREIKDDRIEGAFLSPLRVLEFHPLVWSPRRSPILLG